VSLTLLLKPKFSDFSGHFDVNESRQLERLKDVDGQRVFAVQILHYHDEGSHIKLLLCMSRMADSLPGLMRSIFLTTQKPRPWTRGRAGWWRDVFLPLALMALFTTAWPICVDWMASFSRTLSTPSQRPFSVRKVPVVRGGGVDTTFRDLQIFIRITFTLLILVMMFLDRFFLYLILDKAVVLCPFLVKYFDMPIWHPTDENTLDSLLDAQVET
jgi:hypothetical protein